LQTSSNEARLVDLWISRNEQLQGAGCKPARTHRLPACCCQQLRKAASSKAVALQGRSREGASKPPGCAGACASPQRADPALLKASCARARCQGRQLWLSQVPLGGWQAEPSWSPLLRRGIHLKVAELSCSKGSLAGGWTHAHGSAAGLRILARRWSKARPARLGACRLRSLGWSGPGLRALSPG
jgi:hypothetical protein